METPFRPFRLRLMTLWPALAALAAALALLWWQLPQLQERTVARQLFGVLDLLAPQFEERLSEPQSELQAWTRELAADAPLRITLIDPAGRVLADSARNDDEIAYMENHGGRPEVRAAAAAGRGRSTRRSTTTGLSYVYTARPIGDGWTLRLAQPLDQMRALRERLAVATAVAALVGLLAMIFVSWHLDRRYVRPATELFDDAMRLAELGFGHRVRLPEQRDLARLARVINHLTAQSEEQLTTLAAERDQLRAILASMSEGVLVTGPKGRALLANPSFREIFRLRGPVVGRTPLEICRRPQLAAIVDRVLTGRATDEEQLETEEGKSVVVTGRALAERGGAVIVARDVTEQDRLVSMRRDFVANVSHELKTPLAAIRGYAETLTDGALDDPEVARRFVGRILGQCRRLEALLADLLTLSRLESVELGFDPRPVDLAEIARRAVETVREEAKSKGLELAVELEDAPRLAGRAADLERMLVNLLLNAIKYNRPAGHVLLRLAIEGEHAVLSVEDSGLGIPQEALPRLFERFYRVDKGRSRAEGGTGLGLSIVKHIVQAHDGEIEVESSAGEGSIFRIRLPAGRDPVGG